jgi:hypothetical protein
LLIRSTPIRRQETIIRLGTDVLSIILLDLTPVQATARSGAASPANASLPKKLHKLRRGFGDFHFPLWRPSLRLPLLGKKSFTADDSFFTFVPSDEIAG